MLADRSLRRTIERLDNKQQLRSNGQISLLMDVQNVKGSDTTGDAMKLNSLYKKHSRYT